MTIELAYILERGRMERLQTLKHIFNEGRLGAKYQDGLRFVSEALEMNGIEDFLDHATPNNALQLKTTFAQKMREVIATTVKTNP